jgi:hypothetical protein
MKLLLWKRKSEETGGTAANHNCRYFWKKQSYTKERTKTHTEQENETKRNETKRNGMSNKMCCVSVCRERSEAKQGGGGKRGGNVHCERIVILGQRQKRITTTLLSFSLSKAKHNQTLGKIPVSLTYQIAYHTKKTIREWGASEIPVKILATRRAPLHSLVCVFRTQSASHTPSTPATPSSTTHEYINLVPLKPWLFEHIVLVHCVFRHVSDFCIFVQLL